MKMLRITFFAAAALICSTQAYAVMYLARPYEPNMARWLTRDPIGERGGPNLYSFCGNDAVDNFDPLGAVVGNFRVLHSNAVRKFQFAGWSIRFRWSPPNDWPVDCPKCKKAVWIQNWSNDKTTIFSHRTTGPKKDWDESSYRGNSDLWVDGKFPRGSRNDSAEMWDDPSITPLYNLVLYKFLATSCVKCLEGKDAGKIYGCYDWGFTYDPSRPMPDTFGGVLLGPYVSNEIADQ